MKSHICILTAILMFLALTEISMGQPPPPPLGGHSNSGDQPPGSGAPVGSGTLIMLILAVAYASKKVYDLHKDEEKE